MRPKLSAPFDSACAPSRSRIPLVSMPNFPLWSSRVSLRKLKPRMLLINCILRLSRLRWLYGARVVQLRIIGGQLQRIPKQVLCQVLLQRRKHRRPHHLLHHPLLHALQRLVTPYWIICAPKSLIVDRRLRQSWAWIKTSGTNSLSGKTSLPTNSQRRYVQIDISQLQW